MRERGLTSVRVAEAAGITPVYISNIITGRRTPTNDVLEKIADAMGVPFWQLWVSPADIAAQIQQHGVAGTSLCPHCGKPITVAWNIVAAAPIVRAENEGGQGNGE